MLFLSFCHNSEAFTSENMTNHGEFRGKCIFNKSPRYFAMQRIKTVSECFQSASVAFCKEVICIHYLLYQLIYCVSEKIIDVSVPNTENNLLKLEETIDEIGERIVLLFFHQCLWLHFSNHSRITGK